MRYGAVVFCVLTPAFGCDQSDRDAELEAELHQVQRELRDDRASTGSGNAPVDYVPPTPEQAAQAEEAEHRQMAAAALLPTEAERRDAPRSDDAGAESIENSCNLSNTARECGETAHSAVGAGFWSTEALCPDGARFSTDPCPMADRTGSCIVSAGQQVFHFYPGAAQSPEAQCQTYGGRFVPPSERVFPRNSPQ